MDTDNPSKEHLPADLTNEFYSQSLFEELPFFKYKNKKQKKKQKQALNSKLSDEFSHDETPLHHTCSTATIPIPKPPPTLQTLTPQSPSALEENPCEACKYLIQKAAQTTDLEPISDLTRKPSKIENHQTIGKVSQRHVKKYGNASQSVSKTIPLIKPPSVFFNNPTTNCIEEMDIEQLLAIIPNHFDDDTQFLAMQPPEDDKHGNIEYKLKLIKADEKRLQELECQMLRRLDEGIDTCYYHIGLEDNGNPLGLIQEEFFLSIRIISHVATKNDCSVQLDQVFNGEIGRIAFVKIKQRPRNIIRADIRIQLMGETCSGKTTLIKTIYYKESCCSHLNTQTTQIQQQYLCFDSHGKLLSRFPFTVLGIEGEVELATKIISFVDTGGKQRDRKYFVQSYCSRLPNYGLLVISAELGFSEADKLKMRDAITMGIVFFIVITKTDVASSSQIGSTICSVKSFIHTTYKQKSAQVIYRMEQLAKIFETSFSAGNLVPIFLVSSKDMTNIKLITKFLSQLPDNRSTATTSQELTELTIYNPLERSIVNNDKTNENLILQGTVLQGELTLHQNLLIGPDINGFFRKVKVEELMVVKSSVVKVQTSQICVARVRMDLKDKKQFEIRKGQVLVDPNSIPRAAYEFLAELTLFDSIDKDVLIRTGFQPVVSFQSIRQICKIMISKDDLKGQGYRPLARRNSLQREMTFTTQPQQQQLFSYEHKKQENLLLPPVDALKKTNSVQEIKAIKSSTQGDRKQDEKALVFSKNLNKKFLRRTKSIDKMRGLLLSSEGNNRDLVSQKIELVKDNQPVIVLQPSGVKLAQQYNSSSNALNKFQPERKNYLRMRFCYRPELIKIGQVFFIDESSLKAVGVVKKVFYG